jgi:hypothetical protein
VKRRKHHTGGWLCSAAIFSERALPGSTHSGFDQPLSPAHSLLDLLLALVNHPLSIAYFVDATTYRERSKIIGRRGPWDFFLLIKMTALHRRFLRVCFDPIAPLEMIHV